jgi:hypothetical protein
VLLSTMQIIREAAVAWFGAFSRLVYTSLACQTGFTVMHYRQNWKRLYNFNSSLPCSVCTFDYNLSFVILL